MRTITTRNSVYEINEGEKLIRRVSGANLPTLNQGEDGVWQSYLSIRINPAGLLIEWPEEYSATWTSGVLSDSSDGA
jgi:hypothetical protein